MHLNLKNMRYSWAKKIPSSVYLLFYLRQQLICEFHFLLTDQFNMLKVERAFVTTVAQAQV